MAVTSSRRAVVTLPEDTQILITREFDAPARLVYRAWTEPDLVRRWWSGDRGEVTSVDIDLRVGGAWRFVMTANAGFEVAFHGEQLETCLAERMGLELRPRGGARRAGAVHVIMLSRGRRADHVEDAAGALEPGAWQTHLNSLGTEDGHAG